VSRETRDEKAKRLLASTCATLRCDGDQLAAKVVGDHSVYNLRLSPTGWRCPCAARVRDCSHVLAVEAVTGWTRNHHEGQA